jgi:folate-binding protein YgfZ
VSFEEDYAALKGSAGWRSVGRDFVAVEGRDALSFMQGQLSQDVEAVPPGGSADTLLLSPQGKIEALGRLSRTGESELLLDVEGRYGERVVERLARFKLRVKAEIGLLEWSCVSLRGPRAAGLAEGEEWAPRPWREVATAVALPATWPGFEGVDLAGPAPEPPPGARPCGPEAWEAARIEAGVPRMGAELDSKTIPAEAWLNERAVSLTKGCYTGQELVARLDARGNKVARHLRGLRVSGAALPPMGAELLAGGKTAGRVTSAAPTPAGPVALAYVSRQVAPPAEVEVAWEGGRAAGRVEELPLAR